MAFLRKSTPATVVASSSLSFFRKEGVGEGGGAAGSDGMGLVAVHFLLGFGF